MEDYHEYLKQVTAIHNETIQRLINNDSTPPLELAEMFEDIANLYVDISEEIRTRCIGGRQVVVPLSWRENLGEEIAD